MRRVVSFQRSAERPQVRRPSLLDEQTSDWHRDRHLALSATGGSRQQDHITRFQSLESDPAENERSREVLNHMNSNGLSLISALIAFSHRKESVFLTGNAAAQTSGFPTHNIVNPQSLMACNFIAHTHLKWFSSESLTEQRKIRMHAPSGQPAIH